MPMVTNVKAILPNMLSKIGRAAQRRYLLVNGAIWETETLPGGGEI
jgi:hypothetical protein